MVDNGYVARECIGRPAAGMRMFALQSGESHKELFATWIVAHFSSLVHKLYKTMELMLLDVQLHQPVLNKIMHHIPKHKYY